MKVIDILKEQFDLQIQMEQITEKQALPMYLLNKRKIYRAFFSDVEFIYVEIEFSETLDIKKLKHQLGKYQEYYKKNVAFAFESIDKKQRSAMLRNHIPFFTSSGQIYLPFLGISLSPIYYKTHHITAENFSPVTQCMFLYLLYRKRGSYAKDRIAGDLHVTKAAITKSSRHLLSLGLTEETRQGKNIFVERTADGMEYFEKAKKYLINPVQKELFFSIAVMNGRERILAGESALSKYSLLNAPQVPAFAVYKDCCTFRNEDSLDPKWDDIPEMIKVELWKYDPTLFSVDSRTDIVSLYCSLKNIYDERIEEALETALEEYKWQ